MVQRSADVAGGRGFGIDGALHSIEAGAPARGRPPSSPPESCVIASAFLGAQRMIPGPRFLPAASNSPYCWSTTTLVGCTDDGNVSAESGVAQRGKKRLIS